MGKKRHSVETIVSMLREAEVLLGKGRALDGTPGVFEFGFLI